MELSSKVKYVLILWKQPNNYFFCNLDAASFSHSFYRLLDGGDGGDHQERLLEIEKTTFGVIKDEIIKKDGSWTGTLAEHKKADKFICDTFVKSLKMYERNKKDDAPTFFT